MKKILSAILVAATVLMMSSCEKYLDVNTNVDAPDHVDAGLLLPGCLSALQGVYWDTRATAPLSQMFYGVYPNYGNHYYNQSSDAAAEMWRVNYWLLGKNLENMITQSEEEEAWTLAGIGYKVGLLDADIFGPSMPKMFNTEGARPYAENKGGRDLIIPVEQYGIKLLSIGYFVDPEQAVLWRGAMASNALKQLIADADWGELDYFIIDMPPGTSDIHLTLVQTLGITGAVVVSTPQEVALADARKGIDMFRNEKVNVPVLGLVENMAWFTPAELPQNKYYLFGKEGCKRLAEELNVPLLGQIPLVQSICEGGDNGTPVALNPDTITGLAFRELAQAVAIATDARNHQQPPTKAVSTSK